MATNRFTAYLLPALCILLTFSLTEGVRTAGWPASDTNQAAKSQSRGPNYGAHVCNNGIHYYVEHARSCRDYRGSDREKLGCNLIEYQRQTAFKNIGSGDRQVHWYGGIENQNMFEFYESGESDSQCIYGDQGSIGSPFSMPDYCSRAMISELSTVYDAKLRHTSLAAGAKVLFSAPSWNSCGWSELFSSYKALFEKEKKAKACWNMVDDYKDLYCLKFQECRCGEDPNDANCYLNSTKIACCKKIHDEWLASRFKPSAELTNGEGKVSQIRGRPDY
jgi:hypothetical protein